MQTRDPSRPIVVFGTAAALGLVVVSLSVGIFDRREYRDIAFVSQPLALRPATPTGEITSASKIVQTFRARRANLAEIDVYLSNYRRSNRSPVVLTVSQVRTGNVLRVSTAPPGSIGDNRYRRFTFPAIPDSKDRSFVLTLRSPDAKPGQAVTAWLSYDDPYPEGAAVVNGARRSQLDVVLTLRYRIGGTLVELVNRASQYKPAFFKGRNLKVIAIVALLGMLVAAGVVASSLVDLHNATWSSQDGSPPK